MACSNSLQPHLGRRRYHRRDARPRHDGRKRLVSRNPNKHAIGPSAADGGTRFAACDRCLVIAFATPREARRKGQSWREVHRALHSVLYAAGIVRVCASIFCADTCCCRQSGGFSRKHAKIRDTRREEDEGRRCEGELGGYTTTGTQKAKTH